jgi:hypothetical protein
LLELKRIEPVAEVARADYSAGHVPERYRYAHHADFIRLDALIEHGGIYADIDTLFIRPIPGDLYEHSFVIGREADVRDELTGQMRPSLCNALMMAEPGAAFVRAWRERMAGALNGSWSNHSCLLAQTLADEMPETVHIQPREAFMGVPTTPAGLAGFLERDEAGLEDAYSVHWWEHLWWDPQRVDFSVCSGRQITLDYLRSANTTLARLARPFLPPLDLPLLQGLSPTSRAAG